MDSERIIGYTEDITECGKCGRTNLKGCVIVGTDDAITGYYGPECAKQIVYGVGPRFTLSDAQRIERIRRDKIRAWARSANKHLADSDKGWLGQDLRDSRFLDFVRADEKELLNTVRTTFRSLCKQQ